MSISSFAVRSKPKFKLILLGDQSVGKTCLIEQFVNGKFEDSETPTVGIDFVVTNVTHLNKLYRLQLWDTAGQQRFKSLIPSYLRDSDCAIILYDVTKKDTFDNAFKWVQLFKDHVGENSAAVIVANKMDLKSKPSLIAAMKQKCGKENLDHFQVSAKTGQNVKELFLKIIDKIQEKLHRPILTEDFETSKNIVEQKNRLDLIVEEDLTSVTVKLSPHLHSQKNIEKAEQNARQDRKNCC